MKRALDLGKKRGDKHGFLEAKSSKLIPEG